MPQQPTISLSLAWAAQFCIECFIVVAEKWLIWEFSFVAVVGFNLQSRNPFFILCCFAVYTLYSGTGSVDWPLVSEFGLASLYLAWQIYGGCESFSKICSIYFILGDRKKIFVSL